MHVIRYILVLLFCRFEFGRMSGKITRQINFSEKLNIRPYMSNKQVSFSGILRSLISVLES